MDVMLLTSFLKNISMLFERKQNHNKPILGGGGKIL